ncbi:pyridine nucleotide-disulfide oxidoreductase family protein, partial [Vibrio parahaemolyticus AQ3810]
MKLQRVLWTKVLTL